MHPRAARTAGAFERVAARATAFLRAHPVDIALVVALVALTLFVRLATLQPIENGGDPLDNWYFVKQWAYDNDPASARLDHHRSRFGIHWITWIVQSLLGTHPRAYYVPQLFASTMSTALTYLLGRQATVRWPHRAGEVSGRIAGFGAALLLLTSEIFVDASSQLRPGIFQVMYALGAAMCLVRFLDEVGRRALAWSSASALLVFLAYLSHEPSSFLVPGMLLVVWLKRKSPRDLVAFVVVLGAFVLAETAAYAIFTKYWSRVGVLTGSALHHDVGSGDFLYLFERFTEASKAVKLAYYPFFVAAPLLIAFRKDLREKVVVFMAGSFLFFATFFVRDIDPIRLFLGLNERYIVVAMPFAWIATLHCFVVVARAFGAHFGQRLGAPRVRLSPRGTLTAAFVSAATLMALVGWRAADSMRSPHPLRNVDTIRDVLNDTYRRNLPIIGKVSKRRAKSAQVRNLHWAHKGFLDEELFVENGTLRDFSYAELAELGKDERYMPDVPELDADRVRELEKQGCALRLSTRGEFVVLSRQKPLPSRCRPEVDEPSASP